MSTIKVNTIQNSSGVEQYTCKAWVNFNAQGTYAIRGSGNVSSVVDLGNGAGAVNLTNAMVDVNYCITAMCAHHGGVVPAGIVSLKNGISSTTYFDLFYANSQSTAFDPSYVFIAVFR